jgi:hypothetical protein
MTAREAPDTQVVRVIATMRPVEVVEGGRRAGVYAVFDDEEGIFLGLVAGQAGTRFPQRIFADLLPKSQPAPVEAETPSSCIPT